MHVYMCSYKYLLQCLINWCLHFLLVTVGRLLDVLLLLLSEEGYFHPIILLCFSKVIITMLVCYYYVTSYVNLIPRPLSWY